ncbi:outer membrane lipoprotein LolB [Halothiobacillus diazotrophicus]|uniref:Outer-membrane lipoprotein LolB n=1 Tax=Halothiobacillus diazotrophicus TaxID=1860122 RepID=A0A191ZF41_9GAMM|nr:lipoprotein insertase outer membrane protein LolB [Halothiobacillus diazotrophicus]ANJ66496.1 outer membrane lipoprotein LolB [Halothiobacillus diazotrophicus]
MLPFIALLFLSGCATLPTSTTPRSQAEQTRLESAWHRHEAQIRNIANWQCIGRAAVRTGIKGGSVSLDWRQTGDVTDVRLSAPLNQGSVELLGNAALMVIKDAEGNQRYTNDPTRTLEELTGWQIPVLAIPDWIRGLPHGSNARYTLDDHGRLASLTDAGWTISYEHYELIDGRAYLPMRLTLERGDIRLRLALEQWSLSAATGTAHP